MSLKLVKSMWGVDELADPALRKTMFARVVAEGYEAVDMHAVCWRHPGVLDDLHTAGLALVATIHTTSVCDAGFEGFKVMTAWGVHEHLASFTMLANEAAKMGAIAINAHSGVDGWSVDEARTYLRGALAVERSLSPSVPIFHETHRLRLFWSPFNLRDVLQGADDLADIKLNCDISHWVVCLERLFGSGSSIAGAQHDPWWPEVLGMLKARCGMIHARVGYGEGSQVPNPAAPEYATELTAFLGYWKEIVQAQVARKTPSIVVPEHGPWPYQQSVPFAATAPNHSIWEANEFVKTVVAERFPQWVEEVGEV